MPIGVRTSGPIHLFARFRGGNIGLYMGTAVTSPEPELEKHRIPVMNDLGGRSVPFQVVQDGQDAIVFATLNRFNYLLLQSIRALDSGSAPGELNGNLFAGKELPGARGTLVIGYRDFELILVAAYAGTSSAGNVADEPRARIYFSADLEKYKESRVGTRVLEVALAIRCQNVYTSPRTLSGLIAAAGAIASGVTGAPLTSTPEFRLYSENPADIPTLEAIS